MSKEREEFIKCPHCGTEGRITIWESVNVDLDPELKDKIINEENFLWTCPKCGEQVLVPYGFLYHDMKHRYMLFFDFDEDAKISEADISIPEVFLGLNNYHFRVVHGLMDLKEKIFIIEAGLDDIAVEYMKYTIKHFDSSIDIEQQDVIRISGISKDSETGDMYHRR